MTITLFMFIGSICILLLVFSFFFNFLSWDMEKMSAYECGFEPFGDVKVRFEIKFYVMAILFVLFDVEMILCVPWMFVFMLDFFILVSLFMFFFILACGFTFEMMTSALDWK